LSSPRRIRFCILALDLLWMLVSCWFAELASHYPAIAALDLRVELVRLVPVIVTVLIVWTVLYFSLGLDGFRWGWTAPVASTHILAAVGIIGVCIPAAAFISRQYITRLHYGVYLLLLLAGFVAIRAAARFILFSRRQSGAVRRAIVVGSGPVAQEVASEINRRPEMLCEVIGFLCPLQDDLQAGNASGETFQTMGIFDIIEEKHVDELVIVLPQSPGTEFQKLISRCRIRGLRISFVPQSYELYVSRPRLTYVGSLPLVSIDSPKLTSAFSLVKRLEDLLFVAIFGLPAAIVVACCAAALRFQGIPAFRTEVRCGQGDAEFNMHRLNVDRGAALQTRLERFLDGTSLTELPQMWNVVRREMSMVGPRPEPPDKVIHYSEWQRRRLEMPPGITGLAQVHGLREEHSSEEKARFDLQYIFSWSPLLDMSIVLQTVWTLASRPKRRQTPAVTTALAMTRTPGEPLVLEAVHADRADSCSH
jgi:lipopolysaccharide/colanic/teichoic acid biosynthesis glycosyltransferase